MDRQLGPRRRGGTSHAVRPLPVCSGGAGLSSVPSPPAHIEELLARVERDRQEWERRCHDLDERLLAIENSRFFNILRWPGRLLLDWRGRIGHLLLKSPLHPLYLWLVRPRSALRAYERWIGRETWPKEEPLARRPLISVILPVHNPRREWLEAAIDSVVGQTYPEWQLCICDDGSAERWVFERLESRAAADPRIRCVRSEHNEGLSAALNRAGQLAQGEYAAFLDQDDLLARGALYCVAEALQEGDADLLYSDEDYIDERGRRVQPVFKPAFSPDLLRCCMYMCHLLVVRRTRLDEIGWFRSAMDGAQDYDVALRATAGQAAVVHLPRVLYHWRRHSGSTALSPSAKPLSHPAGLRALTEAVHAIDPAAAVQFDGQPNTYRVRWPVPGAARASIVICSRNPKLLGRALRALNARTAHPHREVVVVEHIVGDSTLMDELLDRTACRRVPYSGPFNFSLMNNRGARQASGDVLVFLNDDVEPLAPQWLSELLAHVHRPGVGIAGARLVYPSGAVQHAGLALGIMNGVGHLHRDTYSAQFWNWLPFTRNVSAVTGACLAIRREVFEELGGFDESFPVNYGDADLCLRAREAGYEVVVEPTALLRHYERKTRRPGVLIEEKVHWTERWGNSIEAGDPFYSPHLTKSREDASLAP